LNDYLEEKREKMPRFYFLGDDDLLEILGYSQKVEVIQMHLKKLFAGIYSVNLSEDNSKVQALVSSKNETVLLKSEVQIE